MPTSWPSEINAIAVGIVKVERHNEMVFAIVVRDCKRLVSVDCILKLASKYGPPAPGHQLP
jgi:hypothetical protein